MVCFVFICFYSLSLHFNSHFPGGPGLAGTRVSPFCILLELRVMEMVVTTGAIRRVELQLKCHHQRTNMQFFLQARCLSCCPTNSVKAPFYSTVWPHLFRCAGHEKRRGEQLKWSLAFRLYTGSFPCAQLYQDQFIQPDWVECFLCI